MSAERFERRCCVPGHRRGAVIGVPDEVMGERRRPSWSHATRPSHRADRLGEFASEKSAYRAAAEAHRVVPELPKSPRPGAADQAARTAAAAQDAA